MSWEEHTGSTINLSAQFTLNLQGIVMTPSSLGLVSYYRTASDPDIPSLAKL